MSAISAEARFVMLCVREPEAVAPSELHAAAAAVRDWDAVVTAATAHRVAAFVRQAARRHAVSLPPDAEHALRRTEVCAAMCMLELNAKLKQVVFALTTAGVPPIVLKGPVLARSIYPAAALRPYDDIDLLVQAPHLELTMAALQACGLMENPWGEPLGPDQHHKFGTRDGRLAVDLHTDPFDLFLPATDEAARWRRALPVAHLPGAWMLCPEEQLVQLSVHAHKHDFRRLIWLKDLDLLLRACADRLDWDLVVGLARREGLDASVWFGLRLVETLLGTPVPVEVMARLRPAAPLRVLYGAIWPTAEVAALDTNAELSDAGLRAGSFQPRRLRHRLFRRWKIAGRRTGLILVGRRREHARALVRVLLNGGAHRPAQSLGGI